MPANARPIGEWVSALLSGERRAVADALNVLDDRRPAAVAIAGKLLAALPTERIEHEGQIIGLTGPPGVGKSSLSAVLIAAWRTQGKRVGVLAVDPTSPLSGGALLGDRLRMAQGAPDPGVFIRSLAGRGEIGGLAALVLPMARVMATAFDVVLLETIGVGQSEVDVALHSDTTVLVVQPASGDTLQFLKAGVTEIPAVVAVNKADLGRPARKARDEMEAALRYAPMADWVVPVLLCSALYKSGVDDLVAALERHRLLLSQTGRLRQRRRDGVAAWGLRRLREEFGRHGVEILGGADSVLARFTEGDAPFYDVLEASRAELLQRFGSRTI
ncbi:MAG: methylmalonyl Co-A mutase-associated GTPase MeaB [Myxococcales bacterium]|nr:methylmalonyl Co-A mutase-associated GTPase MeaB [Myxococcales bacterium]